MSRPRRTCRSSYSSWRVWFLCCWYVIASIFIVQSLSHFKKGYSSIETFQQELKTARILLQVDSENTLPIGVGFLAWQLDKRQYNALECLHITLENNVKAIWLSYGEDLGKWINYVREHDPRAGTENAVKIFVQISMVEHALMAINDWKVDVIVVQGSIVLLFNSQISLPSSA